ASGNLHSLYRKGVVIFIVFVCIHVFINFEFFNNNYSNALGMINQVADGGHNDASYALAIISIFKDGEFMI
ncbi:hypothetical protein H5410_015281, partial [Solanum commersonii]